MNILYVYAHPNPKSLNEMIKRAAEKTLAEQGHHVLISDLYTEHFKAIASWDDFSLEKASISSQYFLAQQQAFQLNKLASDIEGELEKIRQADHIIFQFPLWWFSVPAILKGWLDRVLVKGFAYDAGKTFDKGLLKNKTASFIVTTQSPESAYQADGLHGASADEFLRHVYHTLRFVGIKALPAFYIYGAFDLSEPQENKIVENLEHYLKT